MGALGYKKQDVHVKTFTSDPIDVVYVGLSYLHKWRVLLKPKSKEMVQHVTARVLQYDKKLQGVGN